MIPTKEIVESADKILKVDRLGRVRRTRQEREAILEEFDRSGMSGQGFADHYGINYTTFASWRQARGRERREDGARKGADKAGMSLALTEVSVDRRSPGGGALCVDLPGGARLQIKDEGEARLAAELIKGLRDAR
jgi:hypothetical protein